jgi:prevent-host-death family protein
MKTVSATEAKNRLGALIADVARGNDDVVIENHGTPRAALISYEAYKELLKARELQRRREAMAALWQLRAEVRAQNQDLDDEAAEQLIQEAIDDVRARGLEQRRQRPIGRSG